MHTDTRLFQQEVYTVVAAIPYGKVATYGQIAWLIGKPRHARLVGHCLHQAPEALHLPCHRVVNSSGRTAPQWAEQAQLLAAEGIPFKSNGQIDLRQAQWRIGEEP